jgi:preprotein translocase subunit SecE
LSAEQHTDVKRRSSRAAREGGRRRRRTRPPEAATTAATTTAVPTIDEATAAAATQADRVELTRSEARRQAKAEQAKASRRGLISNERTEGLRRFYRETRAEINKVVWPDRETTMNLTLLVIALSVVLGILLGGIDYVLFEIFEAF